MGRHLTADEKQRIGNLLRAGLTLRAVTRVTGTTVRTASAIASTLGIPVKRTGHVTYRVVLSQEGQDHLRRGAGIRGLARAEGISLGTARKLCRQGDADRTCPCGKSAYHVGSCRGVERPPRHRARKLGEHPLLSQVQAEVAGKVMAEFREDVLQEATLLVLEGLTVQEAVSQAKRTQQWAFAKSVPIEYAGTLV